MLVFSGSRLRSWTLRVRCRRRPTAGRRRPHLLRRSGFICLLMSFTMWQIWKWVIDLLLKAAFYALHRVHIWNYADPLTLFKLLKYYLILATSNCRFSYYITRDFIEFPKILSVIYQTQSILETAVLFGNRIIYIKKNIIGSDGGRNTA